VPLLQFPKLGLIVVIAHRLATSLKPVFFKKVHCQRAASAYNPLSSRGELFKNKYSKRSRVAGL
jgi:hypothetical protein